MTYHEQDGERFAGINPLMCTSMEAFGGTTSCLRDIRWESYEATAGKGFIKLGKLKRNYNLAITDRFMEEKMPEDMAVLNDKQIMIWDEGHILLIDIPLGDYGKIHFKNGQVSISADIPDESYDWETDTRSTTFTKIHIVGTM